VFPLRLLTAFAQSCDTRAITRRSRRQAAIRSVIVTRTPCSFSKLNGLTRLLAPLLSAPHEDRVTCPCRREGAG
jgi:hypothetical protein